MEETKELLKTEDSLLEKIFGGLTETTMAGLWQLFRNYFSKTFDITILSISDTDAVEDIIKNWYESGKIDICQGRVSVNKNPVPTKVVYLSSGFQEC